MNYTLALFVAVCIMHIITLTNITVFNGAWNGIAMWLSTGVFIFASTVFGLSRLKKRSSYEGKSK